MIENSTKKYIRQYDLLSFESKNIKPYDKFNRILLDANNALSNMLDWGCY
jgi:hypothetical protein